jgi:hypothetical protein
MPLHIHHPRPNDYWQRKTAVSKPFQYSLVCPRTNYTYFSHCRLPSKQTQFKVHVSNHERDAGMCVLSNGQHLGSYTTDGGSIGSVRRGTDPKDNYSFSIKWRPPPKSLSACTHTHTHTHGDITLQQQYTKHTGPLAVQLCPAHYSPYSVLYSSERCIYSGGLVTSNGRKPDRR